jgi:hypothetical protein
MRINVWKRKADVVYNLGNFTIDLMSQIYGTDDTEAKTYLNFYDRIFPRWTGRVVGSSDVTLESVLYNFCFGQCTYSPWHSATGGRISENYAQMLLLPYLVQQQIEWELGNLIDRQNGAPSVYCTKSYQLSVAPSSFYICSALS